MNNLFKKLRKARENRDRSIVRDASYNPAICSKGKSARLLLLSVTKSFNLFSNGNWPGKITQRLLKKTESLSLSL